MLFFPFSVKMTLRMVWNRAFGESARTKTTGEATGIRSIKQVGMMYVGVEPLQIFDVTVSDKFMMEHSRVNISGSSVLSWINSLVPSCCSITRMILVGIGVSPIAEVATKKNPPTANAIRSCWGLVSHAAGNWQLHSSIRQNSLEIKGIENGNVEALSKEFFREVQAQYEAFVNYMVDPTNGMRQHFIDTGFDHTGMAADKIRGPWGKTHSWLCEETSWTHCVPALPQKKGWLGVPASKNGAKAIIDFMLNIFKNANERQKENFLDDILEDLFTKVLGRNRSDQGDLYDTKVEGFRNCRIPYLNGGLFERDILDKKPSHFPASYFNGLLTMLSQYNFYHRWKWPKRCRSGRWPRNAWTHLWKPAGGQQG